MEFLAKYPESAEAHCILALCHGKEKRRAPSLQAAKAAVGFKPDWSYPHYVLSLTSLWFDDHQLSPRALSEALRINPEDPDYHDLLASIHYQKGMYRTARRCAENGLAYDPEHVGCLHRRGACLFEEMRLTEAEEVLREVLHIDPEHASSQGFLGHIETNRGNFHLALPLLNNALREYPNWPLAQAAWKESLRGSSLVYGIVARWAKLIDNLQIRLFFTTLSLAWWCILLWCFKSELWNFSLVMYLLVCGAFCAVLTIVCIRIVFHLYLDVVSVVLLFRIQGLRQSFNFWNWLSQHWPWIILFSIMIALLFAGVSRK